MPKHRSRSHRAVLALLVVLSACGGKSCSCVTPIKGGFPVAERHENAIQVRATAGMFDFLGKNGATLIPGLLGSNMFTIPPSCSGSTTFCCAMPNQVCQLSFGFQTLSLQPTTPNVLHLSTDLTVKTVQDLPISVPIIGSCDVSIDTTLGSPQTMNATSDLAFNVDKTTNTTGLSAANTSISIQDAAINLSGGIGCAIINFALFKPIVVSILQSTVASQLQTLIGGAACAACTTKDDCSSLASDCKNSQCVEADGTTCVPSLGIEGKVDVGSILASFAPNLKADMDFLAVAGGYASADTGLSLGMLGGALGDPHSSCVPVTAAPTVPSVAQSQTFKTDVLPDKATPYHLGVGLHVSELDTIGWGAFDSGALCLQVGTKQVALLSSQTLGILIPSLQDLTHVGNAPMYLALKPAQAPSFVLGKGSWKLDNNGQTVIDDPLMHVLLPQLSIDFYAFVDERFVRVMTLTADVSLPLSLQLDAAGTITPVFGDLGDAFHNLVVTNSALLAESPSQLAKSFPMLLSLAVGQIAGSLKNIALPALLGLQISPIAITSTDPNPDGANQFLALFANVAAAATTALPATAWTHPQAQASLARLELPPTREFAVTARGTSRPTAQLQVSAAGSGPFEFAWSLDDGPWSAFSGGDQLRIADERLWLQGRHQVEVRARRAGEPTSVGAGTRLALIIDTIAPTGRYDVAGGELAVEASDNVSPASALQVRYAYSGASFGEWTASTRATLPAGADTTALRVQVRDEAGNVADLTPQSPAASGGCSLAGAGGNGAAPLGLLVVALLLWRRRRVALMASAAASLALSFGCGNHALKKGDFESPTDEIGRYSSLVVDSHKTLHVSAYDDSYGNLVYATLAQPGQPPSWQIVDGVDTAEPPDNKGGYRHGILDPGDDVGMYTSLALTGAGKPRIAYYDNSNHALRFASGPHPFKSHAIDLGSDSEQVGLYAALSLDRHDVPAIAYVATGVSDGDGFRSELRVATAKTSDPKSASDWDITIVDEAPVSCAGLCGGGQACITPAMVNGMANSDPSLSTCVVVANSCPSACASTAACIAGTCTTFVAKPSAPDLVEGTGLFVNFLRTQAGEPRLVYYDHQSGDLKLAQGGSAPWVNSFIDGPDATVDVGQFASAAIAADDTIHVAYADATHGTLLYRTVSGSTPAASAETIDDGARGGEPHQVGGGANLILDGSGAPRVVYQDQTTSDLEQATRSGGGWSHSDLASGNSGFGFYPHQSLVSGQLYLSEFVYDRGNGAGNPVGTLQFSVANP